MCVPFPSEGIARDALPKYAPPQFILLNCLHDYLHIRH